MKTNLLSLCLLIAFTFIPKTVLAEGGDGISDNQNDGMAKVAVDAFSESAEEPEEERSFYKRNEKWYIQVQGGGSYMIAECVRFGSFSDKIAGSYGVSVGKHFTPFIGARLHLLGGGDKGRFYPTKESPTYSFRHIAGIAELTVNFLNLVRDAKIHDDPKWNLLLNVGPGVVRTFSFDRNGVEYPNSSKDRANFNSRSHLLVYGGLDLSYKVAKNVDLSFEAGLMCAHDRYNGFDSNWRMDALLNCMFGVRYTIQ